MPKPAFGDHLDLSAACPPMPQDRHVPAVLLSGVAHVRGPTCTAGGTVLAGDFSRWVLPVWWGSRHPKRMGNARTSTDQQLAARAAQLGFASLRAYLADRARTRGWPSSRIASELGVHAATVRDRLDRHRLPRQRATVRPAASTKLVAEDRDRNVVG